MSARERPALMVLGGTAEAIALADRMFDRWGDRFEIITSLAGRTRTPVHPPGTVRVGGFGGTAALAEYLQAHDVRAVVDATHPFATQISMNALHAGACAGVPRISLLRPAWEPTPDDDWRLLPDLTAIAEILPEVARRVFLTVGRSELQAFARCEDIWFLVRMVDPPDAPPPLATATVITGRGPFEAAAERDLMLEHKIDALVCKASGGEATRAKLDAARQLGLPVLMVERPPPPDGPRAADIDTALAWVHGQLT